MKERTFVWIGVLGLLAARCAAGSAEFVPDLRPLPALAAVRGDSTGSGKGLLDMPIEELANVSVVSRQVLGTHTHYAGEWMIGYSYMYMDMDGNRDGTHRLDTEEVLADFPIAPERMSMEMHMFMLMYAPTDDLTLMLMLPYTHKSMDLVTRTGVHFTTKSEGVGDPEVSALYTFLDRLKKIRQRLLLKAGLSLPVGSIDERDRTPMGPNQKLPYPMQIGSGTIDLIAEIAYLGEGEHWAWGGEVSGRSRLGRNSNDYALGDVLGFDAWVTRGLADWLSMTVGLKGRAWGDIDGADPDLNPLLVETADPDLRAGERVDLTLGFDFYVPEGKAKDLRIALEGGMPVYQSLDGPQLETDWFVRTAAQWTWKP